MRPMPELKGMLQTTGPKITRSTSHIQSQIALNIFGTSRTDLPCTGPGTHELRGSLRQPLREVAVINFSFLVALSKGLRLKYTDTHHACQYYISYKQTPWGRPLYFI